MKGRLAARLQSPVRAFMTRNLLTASPRTPLREIGDLFFSRPIGHLPLVENGRLAGLLTRAEFPGPHGRAPQGGRRLSRTAAGEGVPIEGRVTAIGISRGLARELEALRFGPPVAWVYNPLRYARRLHEAYLARYAAGPRRVVFLGMNPGPWGMAQTGVPFGEVEAVRGWLGLEGPVGRPDREHPKRPVLGLDCPRSEVSGRRLWGLMRAQFGTAERFFAGHFVANYCPLLFLDSGGANLTPDRVRRSEREPLLELCDAYLARLLQLLAPEWGIGVGRFAEQCLHRVRVLLPAAAAGRLRVAGIPHPSPANPAANRDWAVRAERALVGLGVWA